MKAVVMSAFVTMVAVLAAGHTGQSEVTPVQKVIQLLEGMLVSSKAEKHAEQLQFTAYQQFCSDTGVEKTHAIAEANEHMDMLQADIEKYSSDAARLAREIAEHEADIGAWNGDMKAATSVRQLEHGDYATMHQDLSESVDALQRAIGVLKQQAYTRAQSPKESFAQVASLTTLKLVPDEAKHAIETFLQEGADGLGMQSPAAHGYEFQSQHIIDILEQLLDKFVSDRTDLEKQEMNSKHAWNMLMQDLTAQTNQATADKDKKTEMKAAKNQAKADATGDLQDTTSTRNADDAYLKDLQSTCAQKAADFTSRQQLRADEITTIQQAIGILSGDAVAGNAEKHLPTLLQQRRATALGQLRAADTNMQYQARVAQYLRARGQELNSRVLSALASRVASDPFAKVKKMIKDLLVRLMEEANEEATHKGWCDQELATNEQTRKEKTDGVETLHAEIDALEASIAKLKQDIADLQAEVASLDKSVAEATSLRNTEKATNTATIADAQEAQTAVAQALAVLKEFYARAAEATALVQKQQPVAPEIFSSPYKGLQSENGGVVGMLEVIQSDFARLEADTRASETAAQNLYDKYMTESSVDKAAMETDIDHKTTKQQDETQALGTAQTDLQGTQKELDTALAYFDKLKPSCVDASVSSDGRIGRRQEEVQSLREALRILNGEDLAAA